MSLVDAIGPLHHQLFNRAVVVFELRYTGFDNGLELACVQVTPLALTPTIDVGSLGGTRWVRTRLPPPFFNTTSANTRWSANERSTFLTDQAVFDPSSCSYSAVFFMLRPRILKNKILQG